mmetsp:Transcript_94917/g.217376  ORF Transcript_94917/g.217376 Transcript_94917/m.217376 type:complete len:612 (+) Transcript_94917:24-1859(+)
MWLEEVSTALAWLREAATLVAGVVHRSPSAPCHFFLRSGELWHAVDPADVVEAVGTSAEGVTVLELLCDACAVACVAAGLLQDLPPGSDLLQVCIRLRHVHRRLHALSNILGELRQGKSLGTAWANCSLLWHTGEPDVAALWAPFRSSLSCCSSDFVAHFSASYGAPSPEEAALFLSWLNSSPQGQISFSNVLAILQPLGVWAGFLHCTNWPELFGQQLYPCIRSGSTALVTSATAQELVRLRRQREASVKIELMTRKDLREGARTTKAVLGALGFIAAVDADDGLLVQLASPEVAACVRDPRTSVSRILRLVARGSDFVAATECPSDLIAREIPLRFPNITRSRDQHNLLATLHSRKPHLSRDLLLQETCVHREVAEYSLRRCEAALTIGPVAATDLWQRVREEVVILRRHAAESFGFHPAATDSTTCLQPLLLEVEHAEEIGAAASALAAHQRALWIWEGSDFQHAAMAADLPLADLVFTAEKESALLQLKRSWEREELVQLELVLLDLEAVFAKYRRRLHEYDQQLTGMIAAKEEVVAKTHHDLARAEVQARVAESKTQERELDMAERDNVVSLDVKKEELQVAISRMEQRLESLTKKYKQAQSAIKK